MKSFHSALLAGGLALLLFGLLPPLSRAQGTGETGLSRVEFLQGSHVFRRVLADVGMQSLTSFEELGQAPERSLLIVLGRTDRLREVPGGLVEFVRAGGALLLASDQRIEDPEVDEQVQLVAGVTVAGELLASHPRSAYQQLPYCPFLEPAPGAEPALLHDPRGNFRTLKVATNLPSHLLRSRDPRHPWGVPNLAYLPEPSFIERGRWRGAALPGQPLFAVGGEYSKGRVLVLADHSLFINQMMLPIDTGNVEFTCNCVRWLAGTPQQRQRVLLVENGRIQTRFDIPLQKVPIPAEELMQALLAAGDRLVAERNSLTRELEKGVMDFEQRNGFNRAASSGLDKLGLPSRKLGQVLLVVLTLAGLLYALYRIGIRGRRSVDSAVPLVARSVGEQVPTAGVLDRRHREMMRAGNLLEPLQQRARAWFAEVAGLGTEQVPRVRVRGSWWRHWWVARRVRWFWSLARGRTLRVRPRRLARLLAELERLQAAQQAGTLELLPEAAARQAGFPVRLAGRGGRG
jgi:hypothetical protein